MAGHENDLDDGNDKTNKVATALLCRYSSSARMKIIVIVMNYLGT